MRNRLCTATTSLGLGSELVEEMVLDILQGTDELIFRLTDFADPIDKAVVRPRGLSEARPGGLGLHVIDQIMDRAHLQEPPIGAGNRLEMRRRISRGNA